MDKDCGGVQKRGRLYEDLFATQDRLSDITVCSSTTPLFNYQIIIHASLYIQLIYSRVNHPKNTGTIFCHHESSITWQSYLDPYVLDKNNVPLCLPTIISLKIL